VSDGEASSNIATVEIEVLLPLLPGVGGTASTDVDRTRSAWDYDGMLMPNGSVAAILTRNGGTGKLVIECVNNAVQDYYLETPNPSLDGSITYRTGTDAPVADNWGKSTEPGSNRLYAPTPSLAFLRKLFVNPDFSYTARDTAGRAMGGSIPLGGLPATVDATRNLCGWPQDSFPAGNG